VGGAFDRVRFSPFRRSFARLRARDLAVLRDVPEGWWVEYKREPNGKLGIAKSIGAFANSEGGWIFYGIGEADVDGEKRAGSFEGIPKSDVARIKNDIRSAANHHVKPTPFYEVRALRGPCDDIGLPANRAVVVVVVAYGHDSPYVHSRGVIYRRKADECDPVAETDRSRLDMLWERGRRERSRLSALITTGPALGESEGSLSYAQLFLLTDPHGERGYRSKIGIEQFRKAVGRDTDAEHVDLAFDATCQIGDSYVARMVAGNAPYQFVPTLEYLSDCSSITTVPLNTWPILRSHDSLRESLRRYTFGNEFLDLVDPDVRELGAHVVDLNYLAVVIMGAFAKHRTLLEAEGTRLPVMVKLRLGNMWRRVPFVDMAEHLERIKREGLPVIEKQALMIPPGDEPESMLRMEAKDWRKMPGTNLLPTAIDLALDALDALGVNAIRTSDDGLAIHLVEAAMRSGGEPTAEGHGIA